VPAVDRLGIARDSRHRANGGGSLLLSRLRPRTVDRRAQSLSAAVAVDHSAIGFIVMVIKNRSIIAGDTTARERPESLPAHNMQIPTSRPIRSITTSQSRTPSTANCATARANHSEHFQDSLEWT
jgi:hypothetical protein